MEVQQEQPKETPKVETSAPSDGYVVPKGEEGLFHIEMQPAGDTFDPKTGKKRFLSFVQKFHPRDFALQVSMNDAGEPVYATVGHRINKILHRPSAELLAGVQVNVTENRRDIKIPITEALIRIEKIIANQPK